MYMGEFLNFFDMPEQNNPLYRQRLLALEKAMLSQNLDAALIFHDDEYLSFELTDDCQRLRYLSGFTGSAGCIAVASHVNEDFSSHKSKIITANAKYPLKKAACVFTDGRYLVQVHEQIDEDCFDAFDISQIKPQMWFGEILEKHSRIGIDLRCISYKTYQELKNDLDALDLEIVPLKQNLVDMIWENRPEKEYSKVMIFPDEFNGCPSPQKRKNLATELRNRDLDATIICDPESICWLLNIRGNDRKYLPIVNCKMVAYSNSTLEWYIDDRHLDEEMAADLEAHFGHIDIFPESSFEDVLERLCTSSCAVYVDPDTVNAHVLEILYSGGAKVTCGLGLCQLPKACKNQLEIAGEYKAHIKDGIAMCRFLAWLDDLTKVEKISDTETFKRAVEDTDEAILADRAESFRKVEQGYIEPSFATISALGPNAAMCHYNHAEVSTPRCLGEDPLYLIDSGAHYFDGTTDITRTVLVGPGLSDEMKNMFTLVLKGHIALSTLIFPKGTSGQQLDAIARRPLWDYGLDYAHGTGHGVGHLLSVHEGPQQISLRRSNVPLQAGMIISDEPGFYKENAYGIRLENLLVVQNCSQPGLSHMLCFSPLTLVPFDKRIINTELLSDKEIDWLNDYHQNVKNVIKNAATTLTDTEISWLETATAKI